MFVVDGEGMITHLHPEASAEGQAALGGFRAAGRLTELAADQILLPGLVDLHVHAPQWPQMGKHLDVPLEDWLQRHTFPLEARYADIDFARSVYADLVSALLANGTTTAVYFATIHRPASLALAETCLALGQRALVGRVAMDDPEQCPPWYRDADAAEAIAETRAFIEAVRVLPGNERGLVRPVITPRFIPACSEAALRGLGALAAETGCHVQTHASESDWEHGFVLERYGSSDAACLEAMGLLTRRTILAHGNFLGAEDFERLGRTGAGVAHCPLSNAYFANAVFPLRAALDLGTHVGLGTDISGGPSPSILDSARQALVASRMLEGGVDPDLAPEQRGRQGRGRIGALEAFWLATAGGGVVLDLPLGQFAPGYAFDAILIDPSAPSGDLRLFPDDRPEQVLEKILYNARRPNIAGAWVAGVRIVL